MAVAASASEKPAGENSSVGENPPLAKIQRPVKSINKDFSPTKNPKLALVNPVKSGQRGRPRNPELPPSPGKYFYWTKARNGLKLEHRKPRYEYIGFIMPNEREHLRGNFNEEYILKIITAAIRVKRARAAESRRVGARLA